jgi:hypothetical protein
MSDSASRLAAAVKPVPGIPATSARLLLPFARYRVRLSPGPESRSVDASTCRCATGPASLPQGGPWLRSEFCCLGPSSLIPTPSASLAGTRRFHGPAVYIAPSLCRHASAIHETFPTSAAVLSARAIDPTPVGLRGCPIAVAPPSTRLPRSVSESPPTSRRLCQQYSTVFIFRSCIVRCRYGPRVCQALLTGYRQMESRVLHRAFSGPRHPRFWPRSSPSAAGSQARWANGKSPIVGTFTRQVTAASEAAQPNLNLNTNREVRTVKRERLCSPQSIPRFTTPCSKLAA